MTFSSHSNQLEPLFSAENADLAVTSTQILLEDIRNRVKNGERVISYFASGAEDPLQVHLNCVLLTKESGLTLLRGVHLKGEALHSLTAEFPLFHCFEREMAEEWEIRLVGHPWLKPVRFSGKHQRTMNEYPFFRLEGKEVHEVGVGPIHAGVIEPGHFRFMCYGETVHHLEIHLGYQHRGVQKLLLKNRGASLAPLVETISGDSSIAHTWAYCRGWEALCNNSVSQEIDLARGIALELERVAMHLAGLAGMSTDIAFLPGGSTYGRLRTTLINTSMRFCGSRFGRGWLRPGEVRFRMDDVLISEVIQALGGVREDIRLINDLFQNSHTVKHRLVGTGSLAPEMVSQMGFVGMVARSSGVFQDARMELPGELYRKHSVSRLQVPSGDCWARAFLRILEIDHSIEWLLRALEALRSVAKAESRNWKIPLGEAKPNRVAIALTEGWRGEVLHFLETDGSGNLRDYRVQDPSLRNWFALALAVRGNAISDFPICNKSFDLSYCGNDL